MTRKHMVCVLVVAALIGGLSPRAMAQGFAWRGYESVIEEIQDSGVLRVGLGLFAPWSACDADGELIGFEIEVATRLAEDMGVEVEFARTNWNYIIPALIAEEFDVIISGMTILPERNLKVNFTSSYNQTGIYLVANRDRTAGLETLEDFNSSSVTIATRRGSSTISAIENVFPEAMILLYDSDTAILEAVVSGMADAARAHGSTRNTWVEDNPDTLHLPFDEPFASEVLAIAVRKGDHDALNFFNSWIAIRKADGWLEQHRQFWFDTQDWEDLVATDPMTIAECDASFQ
ncbi:MAG: transporter substrate-binding domain-containing protein [Bryobacterales bacterium]|nr:transporter substrate-binding domain-containing protein [Bryobacterales bacterium]